MPRTLYLCIVLMAVSACNREPPEPAGPAPAADAAAPRETTPAAGRIDRGRLLAIAAEPGSWLTTGRDYGKTHYSPLESINRRTVQRLGFAWEYQTNTRRGLEATPIVVDGILYATGPFGAVYALDAATGGEIWTFDPQVDGQALRKACCDAVNRGVAVWRGKVYVAALDGRLIALDAGTGAVIWTADTFIDKERGYAITGAPEVAGKVVVIGNGGGELDARGYISAYDLETGAFAWRFFLVPGDPKLGFEHPEMELAATTWDPNSRWDMGLGGTAWDALVYDPELNQLYVGTGNAALYNQADRSPAGGDNLFLTSILAINPDTGRMVWYYQEVPGDSWDYTATQPIILADLEINGELQKVLLHAPKNGFLYVLNRITGKFLSARNFVPQNWLKGFDPDTGAPDVNKEAVDYSKGPKLVFPFVGGAHGWHPMAYSPHTGLVYIPAAHVGNILYDLAPGHERRAGLRNEGVGILLVDQGFNASMLPPDLQSRVDLEKLMAGQPDPAQRGFIVAWDPVAQESVWEVDTAGMFDRSGLLATAGGLVITGSATGFLRAYNDQTGALLHELDVQSSIVAAPAAYTVNGEQYIAVMAGLGGGIFTYAPDPRSAAYQYGNEGRIIAFKLDGGPTPRRDPLPPDPPYPEPPPLTASAETVALGGKLFQQTCGTCHVNAPRGYPPDLRRMSRERHAIFNDIVLNGALRPLAMPQWDDVLSVEDVEAIHAYLIAVAWEAYRSQ
jgi:quinohemoprotein ethanol dehydrogenase